MGLVKQKWNQSISHPSREEMLEIQFERILFKAVAVYFCFVLIQLSKASKSIAVVWSWWHSIQRCSKVRPLVRSICRYRVSLFLCCAFDFVISRHVNRNCHIDLVQHLKLKQSIVVSLAGWLVGWIVGWLTDGLSYWLLCFADLLYVWFGYPVHFICRDITNQCEYIQTYTNRFVTNSPNQSWQNGGTRWG